MEVCIFIAETREVIAILDANEDFQDVILKKGFDIVENPKNIIIENGKMYLPKEGVK